MRFFLTIAVANDETVDQQWSGCHRKSDPAIMTPALWVFPPIGGNTSIFELDVLVVGLFFLTVLHALSERNKYCRKENCVLLVASFFLGLFTEQASQRFGGTHCHASGFLNFDRCSSLNSVLYYAPWVYVCVQSARDLTTRKIGGTTVSVSDRAVVLWYVWSL